MARGIDLIADEGGGETAAAQLLVTLGCFSTVYERSVILRRKNHM
jgi:hypothetical protein